MIALTQTVYYHKAEGVQRLKCGPSVGGNNVQSSRATKPIFPIHRSIAPPMVILVNSGLKSNRCQDCTDANCILTESWGCAEIKNVVLQSVQSAGKLLLATKPIFIIRRIAPPCTAYRADNGNLGNFEAVVHNGTVLPPKQCLYQKVAMGMEDLKT